MSDARNARGQFKKGHTPSKETIEAIKAYYRAQPKKRVRLICTQCGKEYSVYPYRAKKSKFCSARCKGIKVGEIRRSKAKPILRFGYWYIRKPEYHRAKRQAGYAKIADIVLEKKLGRLLKENEVAHHIDECKTNDSPENLMVMDSVEHAKYHLEKRRTLV